MDAVGVAQWVILYMDGKPCILAVEPPGASEKKLLEQFRAALLGHLPEGTVLSTKDIYDAPIEDVVRVGVISLMSAMSRTEAAMQAVGAALAARGFLRH